MTDLQAIEERYSRRNYLNIPIESDRLSYLKNLINDLNEQSGLTMEFIENAETAFNSFLKSYGMFNGVRSIILLKGPKTDPNVKEKAGYFGERIVLEATKLGLGTCFVGGSFDKKCPDINTKINENLVCVITIGSTPMNRNKKENMFYRVMHERTKSVESFINSDVPIPHWIEEGLIAVQKAPSALNMQKVKFSYKDGNLTAFVKSESLFNLVDLGIAKLHFEIATGGKFEIGNYASFCDECVFAK